ncbi:hypothetical protein ABGB17_00270 [Sphaerisporangium sp. B11E5]|uniref:hypothetical protein n=1 Tax=Sphaerisporangium sp. B11E5 TaxID=3153563 RepID=UPI00325F573B
MSMRDDSGHEAGDVRFTESGDLEVFDGRRWNRYLGLPADGASGNRDDPDAGLDRSSPSGA